MSGGTQFSAKENRNRPRGKSCSKETTFSNEGKEVKTGHLPLSQGKHSCHQVVPS